MSALEIQNLSKRYGRHQAVQNLSFSIEEGQIMGFLGPNGAGKSTTMKIICGFLSADTGSVRIRNFDILSQRLSAQKQIGYLPESNPLYPELRVSEYLTYCAKVRDLGRAQREHAIDRAISLCGLKERKKQNIGELSKGYRQRVGLAQALLHDPPILILDEPTTGLDPNQIGEIRKLIREIGKKKTVILSTHILSEVQATCDQVVIINKGERVAAAPVEDVIRQAQGGTMLRVSFGSDKLQMKATQIERKLQRLKGLKSIRHLPSSLEELEFELLCERDLRLDIFRFAVQEGLALLNLSKSQSDLEDVFRKLTA